jgi:hypothetical protein
MQKPYKTFCFDYFSYGQRRKIGQGIGSAKPRKPYMPRHFFNFLVLERAPPEGRRTAAGWPPDAQRTPKKITKPVIFYVFGKNKIKKKRER